MKPLRVVIVGCGNIATKYTEQLAAYSCVELAGFFDLDSTRVDQFVSDHGGTAYRSLDEVMADSSVQVVVNLTIHHAHAEVTSLALKSDKHVYSEKPLATDAKSAGELVALAEASGLRLGSAPSTFLGEAVQTVGAGLRSGKAGTLRISYAEINHGRIETWHPNPAPFYKVGPVWDVAVYPLGVWAALCGPMTSVRAVSRMLLGERKDVHGNAFPVESPDYTCALIDFESGLLGRLTTNFYVNPSKQGASMEFHGDSGSFYLGSSYMFDAPVEFAEYGKSFEKVPLAREAFAGVEFGRGLEDFCLALLEDRPHRCDARMAAHIVDVIDAINESAHTGSPVKIRSTFTSPAPMDWSSRDGE